MPYEYAYFGGFSLTAERLLCGSNHVFRYLSVRVELFDRVGGVAIVLLRWVNVVFSCREPRRTSTHTV